MHCNSLEGFQFVVGWMDHHGRVDICEGAPRRSISSFPAPASSAGVPSSVNRHPASAATVSSRQTGPQTRCCYDVVAASMADVGQSIILAHHGHIGASDQPPAFASKAVSSP